MYSISSSSCKLKEKITKYGTNITLTVLKYTFGTRKLKQGRYWLNIFRKKCLTRADALVRHKNHANSKIKVGGDYPCTRIKTK